MDGFKVCPYCGRQAPSDAQWCAGCGKNIATPPQPQQPQGGYQQPPPPGYGPQPGYQQPPPGYNQGTAGYGPRASVQSSIQMRTETDEIMGSFWAFLPLVGFIVMIACSVAAAFFPVQAIVLSIIGAIIFQILMLVLLYKLLKRMSEHFKRESSERAGIVGYFKEKAQELGRLQFIGPQLGAMESINQEAQFKEKDYNAILWVILVLIPFVGLIVALYLLYILTKNPYEHDQRWHHFTQNAQMAGQQMGINIMMPSWKTLPERQFIIFFVLTIITLGAFAIYWVYVIVKDMNEHLKTQWSFEDQLLREMNR